MYQKIDKNALEEHEWLELLLFTALPRKNTNEIAHALLTKFGSVSDVLFAPMDELQSVPGVGASVGGFLRAVGHCLESFQAGKEPKYYGKFESRAFLPFVKETYKDILFEVLELYLLDGDGRIMKKQRFSVDSICTVQVVPEEISEFLLLNGASGVVMVHNHPYGEALPSETDDSMTKNCQLICSMHNRLLCDHIIYAPNGMYSYYLSGRMETISKNYSVSKFLNAEN